MATDDSTSETPLKKCTKCGIEKPATAEYFHRNNSAKDGWQSRCRLCRAMARGRVPMDLRAHADFKSCPDCGLIYPITRDYFYADKKGKYGISAFCIPCTKARTRKWEIEHPEQVRETKASWREKNRPIIRIRGNEWNQAHKKQQKQYYEDNKEEIAKKKKEYSEENKEYFKEWAHSYYLNNRDKIIERQKHRLRDQLEIIKASRYIQLLRRRARKRSLPDNFSLNDYERMIEYWKGKCAYCSVGGKMQADHFIALSVSDCPGTIPTNMVPACQSCNSSKFNHPPRKWLIREYGENKADEILKRIQDYFNQL